MNTLTRRERLGIVALATVAILLIAGALFLRRQSGGGPTSGVPVGVEYTPEEDSARAEDSVDSSETKTHKRKKRRKRRKRKASVSARVKRVTAGRDTSHYDPFAPIPLKPEPSAVE